MPRIQPTAPPSTAGRNRAYQKLMDAVASFDIANAQLDAVFKELTQEELD